MATDVRLGLIGCGIISDAHLVAAGELPDVRVLAVCDTDAGRLEQKAAKYAVARRYGDWRELLADGDIDAVVVCLPEGLHAPVTVEAAGRGKHVLVEKPMSRDLAECEAMIAAAEAAGVVLMVGQVLRYRDSHLLAKRLIGEGRIGRVEKIVRRRLMRDAVAPARMRTWAADPELAGDWLLYGFGAHEYDALLWLLDTQADTVAAEGSKAAPDWTGWSAIASRIRLADGVEADVVLGLCSQTQAWDTAVTGSDGSLSFTSNGVTLNGQETRTAADFKEAFRAQLAEFVDCVRAGRQPGPSGANVRATMALLEGVKLSLERKHPVRISDLGSLQGKDRT